MLSSLLKDWNYFWNKYCNVLFVAICRSQFPLLIFLASSWHQKTKIALWTSLKNKKKSCEQKDLLKKKWLIAIFKGFIKQPVKLKKNLNFLSFFFFHWLLDDCFFSFLIKAFVNLEKLVRFHRQALIIYKNGEN